MNLKQKAFLLQAVLQRVDLEFSVKCLPSHAHCLYQIGHLPSLSPNILHVSQVDTQQMTDMLYSRDVCVERLEPSSLLIEKWNAPTWSAGDGVDYRFPEPEIYFV